MQDSLIERFEYTLEVAWKTCKRHLKEEGFLEEATGSPKSIIRLAAQNAMIDDPDAWFGYLRVRQEVLNNFSEESLKAVVRVADDFSRDVIGLYQKMAGT